MKHLQSDYFKSPASEASVSAAIIVLLSSLALILLFWYWQPMTDVVWNVSASEAGAVLTALFWLGWLVVLLSTFMISHLELFGLRQVFLNLQGKAYPHTGFTTRGFYRWVRHPIMLGFIIAFWATPRVTVGHLVFAIATTLYILIALQLDEHDLMALLGDAYRNYRQQVPMLLPWPGSK